MKRIITLTSFSALFKVAANNEQFMREVASSARQKFDFSFADRADSQAAKWRKVYKGDH